MRLSSAILPPPESWQAGCGPWLPGRRTLLARCIQRAPEQGLYRSRGVGAGVLIQAAVSSLRAKPKPPGRVAIARIDCCADG
jgi:hypothetical protein